MSRLFAAPHPGVWRALLLLGVLALTAADTAGAEHAGTRQRPTVVVPPSSRAAYERWGYAPAVVTADGSSLDDVVKINSCHTVIGGEFGPVTVRLELASPSLTVTLRLPSLLTES